MTHCHVQSLICFPLLFLVPTPSVTVTAPNTQTVGQPLTLTCNVTTVRGITSAVNMVWRKGRTILQKKRNPTFILMSSSLVYMDNYTISQLNSDDDGIEYECRLVIRKSPPIKVSSSLTLDVIGMYMIDIIKKRQISFHCLR